MTRFRLIFGALLLFAASSTILAGSYLLVYEVAAPSAGFPSSTTVAVGRDTSATSTSTVTAPGAGATTTTAPPATTTVTMSTTTMTATVSSTTAAAQSATPSAPSFTFGGSQSGLNTLGSTISAGTQSPLVIAQRTSLFLAPISWVLLGGAWIWRGRVRARWMELGFESDVFDLFMKMKGGATRIKVLGTLGSPKDRLQLAQELGVDWKTVDRHVQILNKYGFVREQAAYGTVRLYEVTPMGKMLLDLFDELETQGPVPERDKIGLPPHRDDITP